MLRERDAPAQIKGVAAMPKRRHLEPITWPAFPTRVNYAAIHHRQAS